MQFKYVHVILVLSAIIFIPNAYALTQLTGPAMLPNASNPYQTNAPAPVGGQQLQPSSVPSANAPVTPNSQVPAAVGTAPTTDAAAPSANTPETTAPGTAPETPESTGSSANSQTGVQPPGAPKEPAPPPPPTPSASIKVGDSFNGGIVISVDKSQGAPHGLVAATNDLASSYSWIVATSVCAYMGAAGGYRLPTIDELALVNKLINAAMRNGSAGGFAEIHFSSIGKYWSASEFDTGVAWLFDMSSQESVINPKNDPMYVHCVMSF